MASITDPIFIPLAAIGSGTNYGYTCDKCGVFIYETQGSKNREKHRDFHREINGFNRPTH